MVRINDYGYFSHTSFFIDEDEIRKGNMIIDKKALNELTAKAKENPRLRCSYDLRNSAEDKSQRMLNALEPGDACA